MTRAWTLGGPRYPISVRKPGNSKAPGGFAFRTYADAMNYASDHALAYEPYEMVIPGSFEQCTSRNAHAIDMARHRWHQGGPDGIDFRPDICGWCRPRSEPINCDLLLVEASFINPDTGEIA